MAEGTESGPGEGAVLEWPSRILDALRRDRFVLHGQRIVDVASGATVRHELFLRMVEDDRLIPAGEFMVAAEEHGSIREIDQWVADRAIDVAASGSPVHLNLSVRSTDAELLALIGRRLGETSVDPSHVVFELSEAQLTPAAEETGSFLRAVSALGCGIALDHFMTGGPRSFLIRQFPIDYIKLGPGFITGLTEDPAKRGAVTAAVLRAHSNGMKAIAQGVESLVVLEALGELGVDEAQGHVLGAPEPLDSLLNTAA